MIIFSSVLTALDILVSKLYQRKHHDTLKSGLIFNFLVGLSSSVIFLVINKFHIEITLFSCIAALVMTAIAVIYIALGFQILSAGKAAYYTIYRMTGAMVVPYIWGIFFLEESFSLLRACGLVLLILAVFLINSDKSSMTAENALKCIAVFFLAGFVSIISKQHAISAHAVSPVGYVILTSFAKIILCGGSLLFLRKKDERPKKTPKKVVSAFMLCSLSAVLTGIAYMLQLMCAEDMPATMLYPVITGGTIIFSALLAGLFFRERLSKKGIVAIIICFAGTCLFL